jgi:hypothetical protein
LTTAEWFLRKNGKTISPQIGVDASVS